MPGFDEESRMRGSDGEAADVLEVVAATIKKEKLLEANLRESRDGSLGAHALPLEDEVC